MPSVNDSIHGWSPIASSDEDVHISQDMYLMTIKSTCTPFAGATHPSESIASSSGRRAQRNRNRNPSWIPRPRNAFIIFRCEYSREHSQSSSSQEAQDDHDSTNPTVKTLSKRAAEAWKELPPSERERYKVLADKEREEHARLYPHYRFRPMKRQISGTMKTMSQEHPNGSRVPSVERPQAPSAPSTHLPSVLAPAPGKVRSSLSESLEQAYEESVPVSETTTEPLPSYPIDHRTELPLMVDYNNLRTYTFSDSGANTMLSNLSSLAASGVHEDMERAQALEACVIDLYNYDSFSLFPEYY